MKNTFGNSLTITLFGESHGENIGAVIDGVAPGIKIDSGYIDKMLMRRRPVGAESTARQEQDEYKIVSGVFEGKTTGTPICIIIPNTDTRSHDYSDTRWLARPSHADYTANCKYHGFEDYRGGGHFSGRITAALVAAGAILMQALENKGIKIATHIKSCGGISDREFENLSSDINELQNMNFPVLCETSANKMKEAIAEAKKKGDSVGGILETIVYGIDSGLGEPWFDTVEGLLSHALFSIPAIKGVEFGAGFSFAEMFGSQANDPFIVSDGKVKTATNNSGGINGGITNGMPVIFRCAVRPTPTISVSQQTVNFKDKTNEVLSSKGRHDPCIAHRACVVVDCVTALTVADILCSKYGTDWLA